MDRTAIVELISARYAQEHGAVPDLGYPVFRGYAAGCKVGAGLGYRRADTGPLFLENYLDVPVEQAVGSAFGRDYARCHIVEIGNMAAETAPAMIALWAEASNDLGHEAEIAVAVLTAPLRGMFGRLGVKLTELGRADPARLGASARQWGQYYRQDPIICASSIADGQACLARFSNRLKARTA